MKKVIEFIKHERISTLHSKRFIGIRDTLIGWFLTAISYVFFSPPFKFIELEFSFVILFASAFLFLLIYLVSSNLFSGNRLFHNLWMKNDTETSTESHLTVKQRIKWVYFRGLIATGGYICFSLAKIAFSAVDNASIFGADAIIYAILAYLILGEKFTKFHWLGLCIAGAGVFYLLFFDAQSFLPIDGVIAGSAGFISAIALTIIFFITGLIVRHDTPKRVALHQCLCGFILSLFVLVITVFINKTLGNKVYLSDISFVVVRNAILSGALFAAAMVFFLRAFLYTQPVVIAVLGYSLNVFVIILQSCSLGTFPSGKDIGSSALILVGCSCILFYEYKREMKSGKILKKLKPVYDNDLRTELNILRQKYHTGNIDRYQYLSEHHEYNKLILEYPVMLVNSGINKIQITDSSVVFSIGEFEIKMETDGSARSVPFEMLNFGSYEPEDESIAYELIKDGDSVFDVGAHIGWYSLNFAKRFPTSKIYSFEPVPTTYKFLVKNVELNEISNIKLENIGLLNEEKVVPLVYFKGGSALASMKNLINHKKTQLVNCNFTTLDKFIEKENVVLDFLKCDVEGAELFVIQGGIHSIKKYKPIILMEVYNEWCKQCGYDAEELISLLNNQGYDIFESINYELKHCNSPDFDRDDKYNYFFLHKEKHKKIIDSFDG